MCSPPSSGSRVSTTGCAGSWHLAFTNVVTGNKGTAGHLNCPGWVLEFGSVSGTSGDIVVVVLVFLLQRLPHTQIAALLH
jgi:hypothetical protein